MASAKHFLEEQFRRLSLKPGAPTDEYAIKQWREQSERIVDSIGQEAFLMACQRWAERQQFFPTNPDSLRQYSPGAAKPVCASCRNSEGWVYVVDERNGREMVKKCSHPGGAA